MILTLNISSVNFDKYMKKIQILLCKISIYNLTPVSKKSISFLSEKAECLCFWFFLNIKTANIFEEKNGSIIVLAKESFIWQKHEILHLKQLFVENVEHLIQKEFPY